MAELECAQYNDGVTRAPTNVGKVNSGTNQVTGAHLSQRISVFFITSFFFTDTDLSRNNQALV